MSWASLVLPCNVTLKPLGPRMPTCIVGWGTVISKVPSTNSCPLPNLEPRHGTWTRLPSAWAVPGLEMQVLLTLHPKPSPGSRWVISFTSEASMPTFAQMMEWHCYMTDVHFPWLKQKLQEGRNCVHFCSGARHRDDTQYTCAECRSNGSCLPATAGVTLAS